jgi:hypothetical protein
MKYKNKENNCCKVSISMYAGERLALHNPRGKK